MKIKLEDEKDIFEAITEPLTEEEINKWKYIQDMFSGWKEQDSEQLNRDGRAWRRVLGDFYLPGRNCWWNVVPFGNSISGSSVFSKTSLNIWKFMVHILLKPGMENSEHYFASV